MVFGKGTSGKVKVSAPPEGVSPGFHLSLEDLQSRLFGFTSSTRMLVVEVCEGLVKMAGFTIHKKQRRLVCMGSVASGNTDLEIGIKIRTFLRAHFFKPTDVVVLHPSYNLTSRILNLPSTDAKEIRDIIDLQAVKQTPYSREEITTGFRILESDPSGYSKVLLAISHRDLAASYYRAIEMAGFQARCIHIAIEGLRGWFEALRNRDPQKYDKPMVLLDVDWSTTEFMLFQKGKLVFNRNISMGVRHLGETADKLPDDFLREIQRSLEGGQAELKDETISGVILSSMSPKGQGMTAHISRELNLPVENISSLNPFDAAIPKGVHKSLAQAACSFSSILGFGFDPNPAAINLIPNQLETKKGLENRAKDLAILGTMMLALVTLLSIISFEKIYKKDQYLRNLNSEHAQVAASAEDTERMIAKMQVAADQMSSGTYFLDVLYDVTEVLPSSLYLTSLQYQTKDSSLVVRGISDEMSSVFKLITTLEGTPHLEAVKTRNVAKRKVKDKEVVEFEISAMALRNAQASEAPSSTPVPA